MALPDLPKQELLGFFERMMFIRRFEERLVLLSLAGHRFGHFAVGRSSRVA